ncbi:MAG: hypothetical protein QM650_03200 [Microlunatus sp.]
MEQPATAVLRFHRTVAADTFRSYAEAIGRSVETMPGCLNWQLSVLTSDRLDWAITATFRDEASLHEWLDDLLRAETTPTTPLSAGVDIVIGDQPRTDGMGLVYHRIEQGGEAAFIAAQEELTGLAGGYPGYQGTTVLPPTAEYPRWTSMIRFRTEHQLRDWMESATREATLPQLQQQLGGRFQVVTHQSFGATVRVQDGVAEVTPNWKTNMVVLLVLYPTVMLLSRFVDPLIRKLGTDVWLTMFLSQAISVSLLTWVMMPAAGRVLRGWLDPRTGAGWHAGLRGTLIVVAGYLVNLAIFSSVEYLQFWRQ